MQLVVGRIGRAHGLRGEVIVEVRTDDPDARFAPGSVAGHRPGRARAADGGRVALALRAAAGPRSRGGRPDRGRGAARHAARGRLRAAGRAEDPDEFYDHQLVGLAVVDRGRATGSASVTDVAAPARICGTSAAGGRWCRRWRPARRLVPFVAGDRAGRRRRGRAALVVDPPDGPVRARRGDRRGAAVRIDIVTIFPDYLAPLRRLAASARRVERGLLDVRRARPARWTTDRHRTVDDTPVRRRPGHGDAARAVGRGAGRAWSRAGGGVPACRRLVVPTPAGRPFTQAAAPRAGGRAVADLRLRPVRGHRPAGGRLSRASRMPVDEVSHRRLRAGRRRGRRAGDGRGDRPAAARRAGQRPTRWRTIRSSGGPWPAPRGPGLHPAAGLAGAGGAGGAAVRRPRRDRPLAARRRRCAVPRRPAGPAARLGPSSTSGTGGPVRRWFPGQPAKMWHTERRAAPPAD